MSCQNSGFECADHFLEASKIVEAGATSKPINDFELSRYACYLIVQNGDPCKEPIALGQTYFASGAKKVLLPITSAGDLGSVPSDLIGAFSLIFYSTPQEAVFKALGVE